MSKNLADFLGFFRADPGQIPTDPDPNPYPIRGSTYPVPGPDRSGNIALRCSAALPCVPDLSSSCLTP
jgi:hypothetical protein